MSAAIATLKTLPKNILSGTLLLGRYRVHNPIESDPLYTVYSAIDEVFGEVEVWINVFNPTLPPEVLAEKFPQAAQMAAYVGSTCIHASRILGYGFYEDTIPFRVTEVLTGKSLIALMREGSIALERSLQWLSQICTALHYAHQGTEINGTHYPILHRDLKPSAIWVELDSGLGDVVKVRHFGLSHLMMTTANHSSNRVVFWGTPAYSAPEVFQGQTTAATDIYSFGIIAYRLLTDQMPIMAQGKTLRDWAKAHHEQQPKLIRELKPDLELSPIIDDLIVSCLAKDPERRPADARSILETLQACFSKSTLTGSTLLQDLVFQAKTISFSATNQATEAGLAFETQGLDITQVTETGLAFETQAINITQTLESEPPIAQQGTKTLHSTDPDLSSESLTAAIAGTEWPDYLPVAEIVFAQTILSHPLKPTALWAMLAQGEPASRLGAQVHCHFHYQCEPYPVMLWVTMLYCAELGARWLPCYLDLGKTQGQRLVRALMEQDTYSILLFGLDDPKYPQSALYQFFSTEQKEYLQKSLTSAEHLGTPSGTIAESKALLKQEFLAMKSKLSHWNI